MEDHPETDISVLPGLPTEMSFKIFEKLDDRSLLSCRLVNRSWCEAASNFLYRRSALITRPCCSSSPDKEDSLASFIKCFQKSRQLQHTFPCTNFMFRGTPGDIFNCPDLKPFFTLSKKFSSDPGSGLLIRCLHIYHIPPCEAILSNWKHLIFEAIPHLRKLCLSFTEVQSKENVRQMRPFDDSFEEEKKLPSLQVVLLYGCVGPAPVQFVSDILKAAPNLQKIDGTDLFGSEEGPYRVFHPDHLQVLLNAEKIHLVNECEIVLCAQIFNSGILNRETLSGFRPTFLNMKMGWHNMEQTKVALRELLWTVRNEVEELRMDDSLGPMNNLDFPRFSKLKRLYCILHKEEYPLFPLGVRDRDVFPKLEKISILTFGDIAGDRIFPDLTYIPIIPSVHTLLVKPIRLPSNKAFLESMTFMCPNLRNFELSFSNGNGGHADACWVNPLLWKNLSGLRTLTLTKILLERMNSMEKLEAWFTGFSLRTVLRLKAMKAEDRPSVEEVESLRVNPSILQLTELKRLVINHRYGSSALPLSFKYGFSLIPELTVDISSS